MPWYEWMVVLALGISLCVSLVHFVRIVNAGIPRDLAPAAGEVSPAVRYSFTGAMSPTKKESAYLHLPTYATGIIFHLGTFLSFFLFVWIWIGLPLPGIPLVLVTGFLTLSVACGLSMLGKRILERKLRLLSNPDDYLSNMLVDLFQATLVLSLWISAMKPFCFLTMALLLLYFPVGKLKHALYFFAARYQLGWFFGRRGVWPP